MAAIGTSPTIATGFASSAPAVNSAALQKARPKDPSRSRIQRVLAYNAAVKKKTIVVSGVNVRP